MKKIIFSLLVLGGMLTTSCEMDLPQPNILDEGGALVDMADCLHYRNGIYNGLRSRTTGSLVYLSDLQMDQFVGITLNGNRNGAINNGNITSSTSEITNVWASYYAGIVSTNYFFINAQVVLDAIPEVETDKIIIMNRYMAEAHFARAYYYYKLTELFCPIYTEENKDTKVGLPLRTDYKPLPDKSTYPSRSTLAETYKFIEDELQLAYDGLKKYEEAMPEEAGVQSLVRESSFLNTWIVKALQARCALLKGDYKTAMDRANEVIGSGLYKLVDTSSSGTILNKKYLYTTMWQSDTGSELMFRPYAAKDELYIGATGAGWLQTDDDKADFLPVGSVVNGYYQAGDIRAKAFFGTRNLFSNGITYNGATVFNKWPGNYDLRTDPETNNLANMGKPFRLSEMYLIKMECQYELGEETEALKTLNNFRKNRIEKYTDESYSGNALKSQIQMERTKELIGEGFRLADCRRWKVQFTRVAGLPQLSAIIVTGGDGVHYTADDHRYVWPIPADEMQVNPNLAGQQNPGY